MDIKTISSLKASSKELSNNATLGEIDLQTSEIPKSESRVGENEENAKITEVKTSENPTSRVRHSTEVKTSELLINRSLVAFILVSAVWHLPLLVSQRLLDSVELSFKYANKEHILYHFFINAYYCHSVDKCNAIFQEQDF